MSFAASADAKTPKWKTNRFDTLDQAEDAKSEQRKRILSLCAGGDPSVVETMRRCHEIIEASVATDRAARHDPDRVDETPEEERARHGRREHAEGVFGTLAKQLVAIADAEKQPLSKEEESVCWKRSFICPDKFVKITKHKGNDFAHTEYAEPTPEELAKILRDEQKDLDDAK